MSTENAIDRGFREQAAFVSPMYDQLETNIPHSLMAYSDDPSLAEDQLFPNRKAVLRYLNKYASSVKHLIKFETQVTEVQVLNGTSNAWQVSSRELTSGQTSVQLYDAVIAASGHYAVPYVPDIKGVKEWNEAYPRRITHSKFYRRPDNFKGMKTVLIGKSASGLDISNQISPFCRPPLLISQRSISSVSDYREGGRFIDVPEIVEFLSPGSSGSERAVRFADGHIEKDIDAVLFCTGYFHSYPYLSSLQPPLITNGERTHHLYQHIFYIPNPTLAFVGVPSKILPFRTAESQAAIIASLWRGRLQLPSKAVMCSWEESRIEPNGRPITNC